MTVGSVEAVVFWRYISSPFKAAYGRFPGTQYTKDYLQVPTNAKAVLDDVLQRADDEEVEIEWRWPGHGTLLVPYKLKTVDARTELFIRRNVNVVRPFQLGDPDNEPFSTFPGDRTRNNEADANAEHDVLEAQALNPFIVAIKLEGEYRVLHARAYLGNPPAGLEHRGLTTLPNGLADAIRDLPGNQGAGTWRPSRPVARAPELVARIKAALARDPNLLLIGPPGTGKTVALEDLRTEYEQTILFDTDQWDNNWFTGTAGVSPRRIVNLVFHPSYSYEDFVAGLFPKGGAGVELKAKPGPLVYLAHWAKDSDRDALLILDEFNRGAAAAIFGDTLALLDRDKRDRLGAPGAWIERPFPNDGMTVPEEFRSVAGSLNVEPRLRLPSSIKIVAAMNSTDRSVAPIDAALRRRFAIINVEPDYDVLAARLRTGVPGPAAAFVRGVAWTVEEVRELAMRLLMTLNGRILDVLGQDFLLGHALLWHVQGELVDDLANSLAHAFDERIVATLRLTFADQDEALAAILGIDPAALPGAGLGGWRRPVGRMEAVAPPRLVTRAVSQLALTQEKLDAIASVL